MPIYAYARLVSAIVTMLFMLMLMSLVKTSLNPKVWLPVARQGQAFHRGQTSQVVFRFIS